MHPHAMLVRWGWISQSCLEVKCGGVVLAPAAQGVWANVSIGSLGIDATVCICGPCHGFLPSV